MRRNLRGAGTLELMSLQVRSDLLATGTRRLQILRRLSADFGLSARASLDLVPERAKPQRQLRPVDRRHVLLSSIELSGLQGTRVIGPSLGEVEDDDVRVQLRRGVAAHRPRAVVFEPGGDPLP